MKSVVLALVAVFLITQPGLSQSESLSASVELNQKLPSIDPTLSPGSTFDKDVAKQLLFEKHPKTNDWFRIPKWLAGSWESNEAVTTFSRDEKTGYIDESPRPHKSAGISDFGDQIDKVGDVWQKIRARYIAETEGDDTTTYAFMLQYEPVECKSGDMDTFTSKSLGVNINVDRESGKIVSTHQRQTLTRHTRISNSLMRSESMHRTFDWQGTLLVSAINLSNEKKVQNLVISKSRKSFTSFLTAHGMENLIPEPTYEMMLEELKRSTAKSPAKPNSKTSVKSQPKKVKSVR